MTKEDMQDVLREVLLEQAVIHDEQHNTDHEFIQLLKLREERRILRVEKFKQSIIGTVATVMVGAVIWVGKLVIEHWPHGS